MNRENVKDPAERTERCVCCSADTGIPVTTPLKERKHYIVGCGQLCPVCYSKIKLENSTEDSITEEDLELLLEISAQGGAE